MAFNLNEEMFEKNVCFGVYFAFQILPFQNKGPNGTLVGGRHMDARTDSGNCQTLAPLSTNRYFMVGPLPAGDGRNGGSLGLFYKGQISLA